MYNRLARGLRDDSLSFPSKGRKSFGRGGFSNALKKWVQADYRH